MVLDSLPRKEVAKTQKKTQKISMSIYIYQKGIMDKDCFVISTLNSSFSRLCNPCDAFLLVRIEEL